MILKIAVIMLSFFVLCASNKAFATKTVSSPYVHQGEASVEWKGGYDLNEGDDEWAMEVSGAYGVTDWWETEIGMELVQEAGDDFEAQALVFENKFQLAPKGALILDPGLKVEYARSLKGGADEIQAKLILAKKIGQFSHLANIAVSREVGDDVENDLEYGFSYALAYEQSETFAYGLEWYSGFGTFKSDSDSFDEQSHQIGPVAYGELSEGVGYEAGVLFGLTDHAPDATLKAVLEYEF